ncbi:hypothetical protein LEP1GSC073_0768 [Leptospira noguchii str. Cascata]|nr:hypothetical protein LEP1GSC073_0768 [Leptospira noguchii str. Cascata]
MFLSLKRFRKKRFAEFNFDSKILFNLWGWLWLSMDRSGNSTQRSLWVALWDQVIGIL